MTTTDMRIPADWVPDIHWTRYISVHPGHTDTIRLTIHTPTGGDFITLTREQAMELARQIERTANDSLDR